MLAIRVYYCGNYYLFRDTIASASMRCWYRLTSMGNYADFMSASFGRLSTRLQSVEEFLQRHEPPVERHSAIVADDSPALVSLLSFCACYRHRVGSTASSPGARAATGAAGKAPAAPSAAAIISRGDDGHARSSRPSLGRDDKAARAEFRFDVIDDGTSGLRRGVLLARSSGLRRRVGVGSVARRRIKFPIRFLIVMSRYRSAPGTPFTRDAMPILTPSGLRTCRHNARPRLPMLILRHFREVLRRPRLAFARSEYCAPVSFDGNEVEATARRLIAAQQGAAPRHVASRRRARPSDASHRLACSRKIARGLCWPLGRLHFTVGQPTTRPLSPNRHAPARRLFRPDVFSASRAACRAAPLRYFIMIARRAEYLYSAATLRRWLLG